MESNGDYCPHAIHCDSEQTCRRRFKIADKIAALRSKLERIEQTLP